MKKLITLISLAALAVAPLCGQTIYQNVQAASGAYTDNTVFRRDGTANRAQTSGVVIEDTASNNTTIGGVDAATDVTVRGGVAGATIALGRAATGAVAIAAAGTNQGITLTPSGTGSVVVGGTNHLVTSPAATALNFSAAGGAAAMTFGTSGTITVAANIDFRLNNPSGNAAALLTNVGGSGATIFRVGNDAAAEYFRASATQFQLPSTNTLRFGTTANATIGLTGTGDATTGTLTHTAPSAGIHSFVGGVAFTGINTQTGATYTILSTDNDVILNRSGGVTVTLGTATAGRTLWLRTISADAVVSASSNVVPLAGGAAGTAILAATAGKWAKLVGDGTNWQMMAGN